MESKNLSIQWIRIRDDLKKGYDELEGGRFNFAHIVFDKVLSMDENCGSAYLGKALADMEQKSLLSAFENNLMGELYRKLFHTSDKIRNAVLSDQEIKNSIFEYGYNSAENIDCKDAKAILEFLQKHNYKDSTSRIYMCESYIELEKKASNYQEKYRQKISAEFPVAPIAETPLPGGLKKLITNEAETARKYPGIIGELKRIDYLYRDAQVPKKSPQSKTKISDWMSFKNWVIFFLLLYVWPIAVIYLIVRYDKYNKGKIKPKKASAQSREEMDFYENEFKRVIKRYNALSEELCFTLETMLGEEAETFESEARSLGFMVGRGKELIEKYSKI